eukprot:CAMPEP_0176056916 /NCGR_PEP_ID=MMETSP0120_2-20121206/28345_1 /TAXON_ID=160619 /ORGANISM="Kryptoperidinium foliaceum, Strain CCMP 1326" /LENGTH=58 /DNA_ID=CAMNT_0017390423 /DNA_START=64 /DNA_END=237 /DNA_ORIENTATION=+
MFQRGFQARPAHLPGTPARARSASVALRHAVEAAVDLGGAGRGREDEVVVVEARRRVR